MSPPIRCPLRASYRDLRSVQPAFFGLPVHFFVRHQKKLPFHNGSSLLPVYSLVHYREAQHFLSPISNMWRQAPFLLSHRTTGSEGGEVACSPAPATSSHSPLLPLDLGRRFPINFSNIPFAAMPSAIAQHLVR